MQVTANRSPVRAHTTPLLARNPKNGTLVVADVDIRGSRECQVHVSTDEGRTWTPGGSIMVRPFTDCSIGAEYGPHAMPFYDRNGVLYVVTTANDPKDFIEASRQPSTEFPRTRSFVPRHVYLSRSTDDGRTFTTGLAYEGPSGDPHHSYNYAPVGAVDPTDPSRIYVGWAQGEWQSPVEPVKAVVSASSDGGRSFGRPFDISDKQGSEHPWVAVGTDGVVHAVYWSKGFNKPVINPNIPAPFAGRVDPVPIYYTRSTDHGQTWQRQELDPGNQKYYRPPVIAADPSSGAVYVAWYSTSEKVNYQLDGDGKVRSDIFLKVSPDGGRSWEPRRTVNDDAGKGVNHIGPGISIAPNGRVDIAWDDFRDSPRPGASPDRETGLGEIYYTFSTDGGRTFAPNMKVNDRAIDRALGTWSNNVGSHVAVGIASAADVAYFAWQDPRNATTITNAEDVYFASLVLEEPDRAAGPAVLPLVIGGIALGMGLAMIFVWVAQRRLQPVDPASRRLRRPA
ncbi:MAG: hypothetical protein ACRD12_16255 [Acidimicrobiales bacterium]